MKRLEIMGKTPVAAWMIIVLILYFTQTSINTQAADENKISATLQQAMDRASDGTLIPVGIWISDIDHDNVNQAVQRNVRLSSVRINEDSGQSVSEYITEERQKSKEAYLAQNTAFIDRYTNRQNAVFISGYAPFVITRVTKQVIKEMYSNAQTLGMELFTNDQKKDEMTYSIPNIRANYTRDTLNLKGTGVKIGIVESGYPDKNSTELSGRNIIFDISDDEANLRLSTHATKVTSIIAGRNRGIAPNATVYAVQALDREQDYEKIEWLIDQGVSVINYSAGYTSVRGAYSDMAKWIDHVGNQHNVSFVKSAGNASGSTFTITDPGMAYNAITVGSIWEHNSAGEPYWQDDTLSTSSCYVESSGGYKPDLTAPGEGIDIAGYTNNSGTSFAAPHVTGVLAQLIGYRRSLALNTALIKAIVTAGTMHKTATDYGEYVNDKLMPYFSDKEGAGVIDALAAYSVVSNAAYESPTMTTSQFPFERSITVPTAGQTVRVSLAWLKQNTINAASHVGATVTERPLSDLDLMVYDPRGNLVASSDSSNNNLELVQFTASTSGTYLIKVICYSMQTAQERIGLAWYQQ